MAAQSINPFAFAPATSSVFHEAESGARITDSERDIATSYALVPQAPAVDASEVEDAVAEAVEITVTWGDNTLLVKHLSPPRSFAVGEGTELPLSADVLGAARRDVVQVSGNSVYVARASGEMAALTPGEVASVQLGDITVRVSSVRAGRRIGSGFLAGLSRSAGQHVGLSFVLHAAVIGSLAFFMPKMSADDAEAFDRDQFLTAQKLLNAAAQRESEREDRPEQGEAGGAGERAQGESGKMGTTAPVKTAGRWQKEGPRENPNPQLSRQELRDMAQNFGMNGLLNAMAMPTNGPTADWAPLDGKGRDAQSFNGLMWAQDIGEGAGTGGLDLFGTGLGGGGQGTGVGLGPVGTLGHGQGNCTVGDCMGIGNGKDGGMGRGSHQLQGEHKVRNISMVEARTVVNGRLPPEVIQRTVRANFGRYRACYEAGLRTNPSLTGRVAVRFVIDRSGAVSVAQDGGSDLPDQSVVSCVVRSFQNLSFAQPEGGIVTVTYPIIFSPGS
jgi:hypothetical protein